MSFGDFFIRRQLVPSTITSLQEGYSKTLFKNDLIAGIAVGIISLPLAMAFAIGAGLPPERGLFTAIIAGFLISLLGGSRVQIGGPTGAYVILVYNVVEKHGYDGLVLATLIAGIILIGFGLTQCGTLIRFIPYPVTTGFTCGIATVLATGQVKDFFGLAIDKPAAEFVDRIYQYVHTFHTFNSSALLVGVLTLAVIVICKKYTSRIPWSIAAIVFATLLAIIFDLPIATVESKFGAIPSSLPAPQFPSFTLDDVQNIFPDAISIAILGGIESLLSAVIADGRTGFKHSSNCELMGQGVANIGAALCGGIPATGAIARTSANVQMHAKTPIAGMTHAITLFVLMVACAPLAGKIPLVALAAILLFVSWNMSEIDNCKDLIRGPKSDCIVFLITYLLTVFIDLTVAVQAGVILAAFLFIKHISDKTTVKAYKAAQHHEVIPQGVEVFDLEGPFFFGVTELLNDTLRLQTTPPKVFILRCRAIPFVDVSGTQALKNFYKRCHAKGILFLLCDLPKEVEKALAKSNAISLIGKEHIFADLHSALAACRME